MRFISKRLCNSFQFGDSSALTTVPLAMRERMKFEGLPFGAEHGGERIAVALADDDDRLALAGLVVGEAAILAVLGDGWPGARSRRNMPLSTSAVFPSPPITRPFSSAAIASRSLCKQHEGALVGHVQIAGQRQRRTCP